ncbi:MAG: alpha-glucan family phosphorylase, partial [Bacteroidales bacterium]|nr:alpha-glucan family phosphorylase [Bacteroidales bacterium]
LNSGRYEFKNKGIDLFIKSLCQLQNENEGREIVAFITVPAGVSGQRTDLKARLGQPLSGTPQLYDYNTHPLHDFEHDSIIKELKINNIDNSPNHKVKVIFAPVYLNEHDGIFNLSYYDLLIGFDLTVFPSYYEPWGYTPLESIAFGIPTITTSLAGFGLWAQANFDPNMGVWTLNREEANDEEIVHQIVDIIRYFCKCSAKELQQQQEQAFQIAQHATWAHLFDNYLIAYDIALERSAKRYDQYKNKTPGISTLIGQHEQIQPHWKHITVKSNLTDNLKPLEEIARNLWWSWNYEARELLQEIAGKLWQKYEENPLYVLQMLSYEVIQQFSNDAVFIERLKAVYRKFRKYIDTPCTRSERKVAYFSMEFGVSNELKIFSGGLGMLAGDYLKEASDTNVNMVAVGLLYRCGYFTQQISHAGDQLNIYTAQSFSKLPITPLQDEQGGFKKVGIALPGRMLYARIWRVDVGRVPLYLLDTDFGENTPEDRKITNNLYGGDNENRLKQELLLGIGGIRMLESLGEKPAIFHLNEGHAAFLSLERLRIIMQEKQLSFSTAMELVRASSLYTTHTSVPAGHDAFSEDLMRIYFAQYADLYHIDWNSFMALGRKRIDCIYDKFSMSILACKLSQEINGVSRIHRRVSRKMFAELYEGFFPEELHIGYVTNGVHYPTWTHKKWQQYHAEIMGDDFVQDSSNSLLWSKMRSADDNRMWQIKNELRTELLNEVRQLLDVQMRHRNESPSLIVNTIKTINNNALTIGFARRFATYKRAYLLFTSEERLNRVLNNPKCPVQFLFAGKAHPHDKAGQDLIKRVIDLSRKPQFTGKIIFLENYDMILAKKLVSGCDLWLNMPTRPLEASGTSGEKAIMNGVLNFSVLDGWWAEGYHPAAGWAISEETTYSDSALQDELDASILYDTIENQIIPAFYTRNDTSCPQKWVHMMKENFARIVPNFTMKRQLDDYYNYFYHKLDSRLAALEQNNNELLTKLMRWKLKLITTWNDIETEQVSYPENRDNIYLLGETFETRVALRLGALLPENIKIELVFTVRNDNRKEYFYKHPFRVEKTEKGVTTFICRIDTRFAGAWDCAIRLLPAHPLLPHDMDLNLVKWL